MNYYNPYMGFSPFISAPTRTGLFSSLFKGETFNLSSIINGTQKTLGIINQAIPVIKQVSPIMKNAKTMFKVMNEFKKSDNNDTKKNDVKINTSFQSDNVINNSINEIQNTENNGPTFFI